MSRYSEAWRMISEQVQYLREEGVTDRKEQMRFVSKHYPFAVRRSYIYRAWLRAKKDFFFGVCKLGRPEKFSSHRLYKEEKKAQLKLF